MITYIYNVYMTHTTPLGRLIQSDLNHRNMSAFNICVQLVSLCDKNRWFGTCALEDHLACDDPRKMGLWKLAQHYNDVIMSAMAVQIASFTIVYSTVYPGADQRKYDVIMVCWRMPNLAQTAGMEKSLRSSTWASVCGPTYRMGNHTMEVCHRYSMMMSSNGNIFRVTGHLCGEFTGPRWIPRTKASDAELGCFLWAASE